MFSFMVVSFHFVLATFPCVKVRETISCVVSRRFVVCPPQSVHTNRSWGHRVPWATPGAQPVCHAARGLRAAVPGAAPS